jgi:hypothetical protein
LHWFAKNLVKRVNMIIKSKFVDIGGYLFLIVSYEMSGNEQVNSEITSENCITENSIMFIAPLIFALDFLGWRLQG